MSATTDWYEATTLPRGGSRATDTGDRRWYCVSIPQACMHVLSWSPERAMAMAGTPGAAIQPDTCAHEGITLPRR